MSQDRSCLPFHFLVSSAQAHLKKARLLRKSFMHAQELHFLKKFEVLVSSSIPSHRYYLEQAGDRAIVELQEQLQDVRARMQELEVDPAWVNRTAARARSPSKMSMSSSSPHKKINAAFESLQASRKSPSGASLHSFRSKTAASPHDGDEEIVQPKKRLVFDEFEHESDSPDEVDTRVDTKRVKRRSWKQPEAPIKAVEEFRKSWKALEDVRAKQEEGDYLRPRGSDSKDQRKSTEDTEFIRGFIAAGRSALSRQSASQHDENGPSAEAQRSRKSLEGAASPASSKSVGERHRRREREGGHWGSMPNVWKQEVEAIVQERMDRMIGHRLSSVVGVTEDVLSHVKEEVARVRDDFEKITADRDSLKSEQDILKFENERMREELQSAREEGLQFREELESFRKKKDVNVGRLQTMFVKLRDDLLALKSEVESLRCLEISLKSDREQIEEWVTKDAASRRDSEERNAVFIERMESYMGDLEEMKEEATSLKKLSEARMEGLIEEMEDRIKTSSRLEGLMTSALEGAQKLQEKYAADSERASLQVGEVRAVLKELTEQRKSFTQLGGTLGTQNVLLTRVQCIEDELAEVAATFKAGESSYTDIAKHQELIDRDVQRLDGQLRETKRKIEQVQQHGIEADQVKEQMKEAKRHWSRMEETVANMEHKLCSLETTVARSVEELNSSLETSLPSAVTVLEGVDKRLELAESSIEEIRQWQESEGSQAACVEGKVDILEDQARHAMSKLSVLDSKLETYKSGVEQAMTGASIAEKKCGVLGGEIVKVFRLLASRNGKEKHEEEEESIRSHSSCKVCARAANNNSSRRGLEAGYSKQAADATAKRGPEKPDVLQSYSQAGSDAVQQQEACARNGSKIPFLKTNVRIQGGKLLVSESSL